MASSPSSIITLGLGGPSSLLITLGFGSEAEAPPAQLAARNCGGAWGSSWGESWGAAWGSICGGEKKSGGFSRAKRRIKQRVYVKVGKRTIWFANEENAEAYLRAQTKKVEERVEKQVEKKTRELPELDKTEIAIPKIVVKGSEELARMTREHVQRTKQMIDEFNAYQKLLQEEDEVMLL